MYNQISIKRSRVEGPTEEIRVRVSPPKTKEFRHWTATCSSPCPVCGNPHSWRTARADLADQKISACGAVMIQFGSGGQDRIGATTGFVTKRGNKPFSPVCITP